MKKDYTGLIHNSMYHQCQERGYATVVDVFMDIGILDRKKYEDWRKGKIRYLESVCMINLHKLSGFLAIMRKYASKNGLKPSYTFYRQWGAKRKIQLRFSKSGQGYIERLYATHYVKSKSGTGTEDKKQ